MPRKYPTSRTLIPTFQMDKPWTAPMTPEEEGGLAETALLSGAPDNDRSITLLLRDFAGDYVANLNNGQG